MPSSFSDRTVSRRTVLKGAVSAGGAATAMTMGGRAIVSAQQVSGLPAGMALVASPRLPLYGVGSADVAKLLSGAIPDWRELGSAVSLKVEPIALAGGTPTAGTPATTVNDYEALAIELDKQARAEAIASIERWFREITDKRLRRGTFRSVPELVAAIHEYLDYNNTHAKPLIWTKQAAPILEKVRRAQAALDKKPSV